MGNKNTCLGWIDLLNSKEKKISSNIRKKKHKSPSICAQKVIIVKLCIDNVMLVET